MGVTLASIYWVRGGGGGGGWGLGRSQDFIYTMATFDLQKIVTFLVNMLLYVKFQDNAYYRQTSSLRRTQFQN